ncbi:unnamed protein product [Malus baccata var. baccata]
MSHIFLPIISSDFNYFLCTQTENDFPETIIESKQAEPSSCLSYRIEKLPIKEPVGSAFQSWMGDGFPIHRGDVMEWVIREWPYRPKELDYSLIEYSLMYRMMTCVIRLEEELVKAVSLEFQNELLYNNLVIACLDKGAIRLPLEYMKKMRELGLARLYAAAEAYVEALEKSVRGNNWSTLDVLIMLYGYLGKEKQTPPVRSKSYVLAVEAFGRIGQLNRAEELWLEMKSVKGLKTTEQFNSMISVYSKHGLIDKASKVFREIKTVGCQPNAITFRHLALGCLKAGLVEEAIKTLELGMSSMMSNVVRNSTPWLETTPIIAGFADKGDVGNAEKFKVYDSNLLKRMILGGARPDAETCSLMKLAEQFQA